MRRRRIRFVGGDHAGYRVLAEPLLNLLRLPRLVRPMATAVPAYVPEPVFVDEIETYRLAHLVDETGITFKAYILESLVRQT